MTARTLIALLLTAAVLPLAAQGDAWDAKFRAIPDARNVGTYVRTLSARPHHLGSAYDKQNAEWILAKFREWGWDAQIERYDVLFPTPKERLLELVAPTRFKASLEEPELQVDPTSGQKSEQLPPFNAYSIDGDVTGPLVYVNYGRPEDYEELERRGVSVKGAIVIARYAQSWRGIKPKVAAEHGAIGCLIYSDPRDDGYFVDQSFPAGPSRSRDSVQRGSVVDMPLYPGDPLTPGYASTADATRLDLAQVKVLTKIPVLPISYGDAQPLLAALTGPVAPTDWRGALPLTYRLGPGAARVHLKVAFNWDRVPAYNVIAKLTGSTYPDEWVVRGNHHDAWVNGADDPISGAVALMETARGLSELLKAGWRPKRTIILALWDGEEWGLLGSTEWAEKHADELATKGAVYINTDSSGKGWLTAGGSHGLQAFMNDIARDIPDPRTGKPVFEEARKHAIQGEAADARDAAEQDPAYRIQPLGSGSDYTPFLQHLTLSALNVGFGGESNGGIYHSVYDSVYWYTHFSDTDFSYGRTLSQLTGTLAIRLADAPVLPFQFSDTADTLARYLGELEKLAASKKDAKVDLAPVRAAVDTLKRAGAAYEQAYSGLGRASSGSLVGRRELRDLNQTLLRSERALGNKDGLPRREWFKHQIYAPGFYTGYGVKTMPQIREGLEEGRFDEANGGVRTVSAAVNALAVQVDQAAKVLAQLTQAR